MKRLVQALVAAFGAAPIPDAWNLRGDIVAPDGTVPAVDPNPHPFWNTPARGATAGRQEYGGDKPGVPHNPEQPVIGQPRCGAGHSARISSRASGQFSDSRAEELNALISGLLWEGRQR